MNVISVDDSVEPIAIVGMSCRVPGAPDVETFWRNLRDAVESIRVFSEAELREARVASALFQQPAYVPAHGCLDDIAGFDAAFFGISPREAEIMDPQHRLFLECAWAAIEHAGYDPETVGERFGVVAGAGLNTYLLQHIMPRADVATPANFYSLFVANDKDFLPTRVSYKLNLRGPSLNVNTACSSSLVAVHVACQMLRSYECDGALAGGVSLQVPQHAGYLYHQGGIASADGHCRAFDAASNGAVTGSGAGVVVLKRLSDAQAAGDTVYAVIRGSAVNNDGALKAGYTAPGVEGQAAAIAGAAALAGVTPESISYVEAHGTGTSLGDPIEISALTQAFGTDRRQFCLIGSVKTNIGHLDAAAGVAGLIKTALALHHEAIPASLHFKTPNAKIDFDHSPFRVCDELTPWPRTRVPRRAGVSSFGIGGTNAHAVLEETPCDATRPERVVPRLFVISARTTAARDHAIRRLVAHLETTRLRPDDVAWTLAVGRKVFPHAAFAVASSCEELVAIVKAGTFTTGERLTSTARAAIPGATAEALATLGSAWLAGASVDWGEVFTGDRPQRVALPAYPFERVRHWIEPVAPQMEASAASVVRRDLSDWFYVPCWTQSPPLVESGPGALAGNWLVFARDTSLQRALVAGLANAGGQVTMVPRGVSDYTALLEELQRADAFPDRVLHCWTVVDGDPVVDVDATASAEPGLNSVLELMRAIGQSGRTIREVAIVTSGVADVDGREPLHPRNSCLLGPVAVIPDEWPGTGCRAIDIDIDSDIHSDVDRERAATRRAGNILRELSLPIAAPLTAWRGRRRWCPRFESVSLPATAHEPFRLGGTFLITGGLGGLGLTFAEHLAATAHANLVLISRRALPPEDSWTRLASESARSSAISTPLPELAPQIAALERTIERDLAIRTVDAREGLLETADALAAAYAVEYLHSCRALPPVGERVSRAAVMDACGVLSEFQRLVDHLLDLLQRQGWLRLEIDTVTVLKDVGSTVSADALRVQACGRFPSLAPMFDLLRDCAQGYPDALRGRVPAISVLFPDGGRGRIVEAAEKTEEYGNHRVYRVLLAEVLRHLAGRSSARRLRILEVGGGNAIMTGLIAEQLRGLDVEYVFTDIGRSFVLAAEAKARELGYAFMTFSTFDISRDPAAQGFAPGSFDAVIGLDVIHATPSIHETVGNLRMLLADGGLLGLVESARTYSWNDMVWGLAEGWWSFRDPELRNPNSPLLETARWEAALANCGFSSVLAFPQGASARDKTDCSLILAQHGEPPRHPVRPAGGGSIADDAAMMAALVRIRAHARSVTVHQVDVADEAGMEGVVAAAEGRFGRIDGVIHAAAIEHKALIASRDTSVNDLEFRPKIDGTLVLDRVFEHRPLDFMVLCSSITAVIGGAGQVGYCAANAFLDAFACRRSREREGFTVSINWGRWQGLGLARDFESWHHARTGRSLEGGMTTDEGLEAFRRILQHRIGPRVAVMTDEWRPDRGVMKAAPRLEREKPIVAVPSAGEFSGTATERQLAEIWQRILGASTFDRHTAFQDLGGDSLVGIQMIARIREQIGVQLPIHAVFDCPTIAALAVRIEEAQSGEMEEGQI